MTHIRENATKFTGRPRSQRARQAVLDAAWELLERDGFTAVTVEAIAARAGVSKATIYRWWPNKAAVVTDSFLEFTAPDIDFGDTGSAMEDLRLQMRRLVQIFSGKDGKIIASLMAESQFDDDVASAFRNRWIAARRQETRRVFQNGIASGEFRDDLDVETAIDALYGPIYYRLLTKHLPLESGFVDSLASYVGRGIENQE